MSRKVSLYSALVATALLAASLAGCGSGNKESAVAAADVAKVGDTACYQCHAATADALTGETFIEQYQRSLHAELGCESCHGGGAQHNGVGPFPYVLNGEATDAQKAARCAQCHDGVTQVTKLNGEVVVAPLSSSPNFQNGNHANPFSEEEAHEAKCARCHSHEGSIIYGKAGFTGSKNVLDNTAYQPVLARDPETFNTIKCATCHEHGGNIRQTNTRDADVNGNIVTWDPNGNKVVDQFDICTSCHNVNTQAGTLIGSGAVLNIISSASTGAGTKAVTTAPYYHNTRWFRTLPATHYDFPESKNYKVEGYVIRKSTKNPCYDCHGHEFQANTRKFDPAASASVKSRPDTVYTDWAQSAHAGHILLQKVAASVGLSGTAQVDAVMKAGADSTSGDAWVHYDWDATLKADGTRDRGDCQACHTATGFSNYANNPTTYNPDNNSFTHLSGWKAGTAKLGTAGTATTPSGQNELLYCWGCHTNSGTGKLRTTGSATLTFQISGQPVVINNVGNSAACVVCHGGRGSASAAIESDAARSSRFLGHHAPTAGVMFAAQTRIAFEYAGQNYINAAFQHDKINSSTDGPCASCHMPNKKHTFHALSSAGGAVQKIYAQSLCNTCHGSLLTTTIDDGKAGYDQASTILNNYVSNVAGFTNYLSNGAGLAITSSNYNTKDAGGNFIVPDEAYGAFQNAKLNTEEPCAYVHNPTYAKRIVFDSIDWMDNGALNGTISFDATVFPKAAAWFGNATATGVTAFSRP